MIQEWTSTAVFLKSLLTLICAFHAWFNQLKMDVIARRDGDAFPPSSPCATTCIFVATGRAGSGTLPGWKLIQAEKQRSTKSNFLLS